MNSFNGPSVANSVTINLTKGSLKCNKVRMFNNALERTHGANSFRTAHVGGTRLAKRLIGPSSRNITSILMRRPSISSYFCFNDSLVNIQFETEPNF